MRSRRYLFCYKECVESNVVLNNRYRSRDKGVLNTFMQLGLIGDWRQANASTHT
jgi:hypothetical protein